MRVHQGCPVCKEDVLGTRETGFYCKRCNLLFRHKHVNFKHMKEQVRKLIRHNFSGFEVRREELSIEPPKEIPKEDITLSPAFQQLAPEIEETVEEMKTLSPAVEEELEKSEDEPVILVHPEKLTPPKKSPGRAKAPKKKATKKRVTKSKKAPKSATREQKSKAASKSKKREKSSKSNSAKSSGSDATAYSSKLEDML
jgi:outer membrane biosynthesis protein TonB